MHLLLSVIYYYLLIIQACVCVCVSWQHQWLGRTSHTVEDECLMSSSLSNPM